MHVTAIEAALAGAVVSAFGSTITGLVVLRSTGSKDHLSRLWERKAETYEAILASVAIKDARRSFVMTRLDESIAFNGVPSLHETEAKDLEYYSEDITSLSSRLQIFGSRQVTEAYANYATHFAQWLNLLTRIITLHGDDLLNSLTNEFERTKQASEETSTRSIHLRELIHTEIQRVPERSRR